MGGGSRKNPGTPENCFYNRNPGPQHTRVRVTVILVQRQSCAGSLSTTGQGRVSWWVHLSVVLYFIAFKHRISSDDNRSVDLVANAVCRSIWQRKRTLGHSLGVLSNFLINTKMLIGAKSLRWADNRSIGILVGRGAHRGTGLPANANQCPEQPNNQLLYVPYVADAFWINFRGY